MSRVAPPSRFRTVMFYATLTATIAISLLLLVLSTTLIGAVPATAGIEEAVLVLSVIVTQLVALFGVLFVWSKDRRENRELRNMLTLRET
jgi:hypothetical protein